MEALIIAPTGLPARPTIDPIGGISDHRRPKQAPLRQASDDAMTPGAAARDRNLTSDDQQPNPLLQHRASNGTWVETIMETGRCWADLAVATKPAPRDRQDGRKVQASPGRGLTCNSGPAAGKPIDRPGGRVSPKARNR